MREEDYVWSGSCREDFSANACIKGYMMQVRRGKESSRGQAFLVKIGVGSAILASGESCARQIGVREQAEIDSKLWNLMIVGD